MEVGDILTKVAKIAQSFLIAAPIYDSGAPMTGRAGAPKPRRGALGAAFGARRARGADDAGLAAGVAAARAEGRLRGKGAEQPLLGLRAAADA
jgi:hypothetical protein